MCRSGHSSLLFYQALFKRRATVGHQLVEIFRGLLRVAQAPHFQHLAVIGNHLLNRHRVVFAVVRAAVIDGAKVSVATGLLA